MPLYQQTITSAGIAAPAAVAIQGIPGGVPVPVSGSLSVGGAADTVGSTTALNGLNTVATVALAGDAGCGVLIAAGTLAATITPEVSYDGGTTWVATKFSDQSGTQTATLVLTNPNAATSLSIVVFGGVSHAQVRVSSFTSGSANATLRGTVAATQSASSGGGAASSVTINDPTTTTQKLAVDANGRIGINNFPASVDVSDRSARLLGKLTGSDGSLVQTANAGRLQVDVIGGNGTNASISTIGTAVPASATYTGWSDGTNMKAPLVFDADTGIGSQWVAGVILRKAASGGSVEAATSSNPLRVDPTGTTTQPVSQSGAPWSQNLTLVGGAAINLGQTTMAASLPVTIASDQSSLTVAATQSGAPWSVIGTKSNNGGAPGASNIGTLPAIANAAAPSYTEGNQVGLSVDLTGALRVSGLTGGSSVTQVRSNAGVATDVGYSAGNLNMPVGGASAVGAVPSSNPLPIAGTDQLGNVAIPSLVMQDGAVAQYVVDVPARRLLEQIVIALSANPNPLAPAPTASSSAPDTAGNIRVTLGATISGGSQVNRLVAAGTTNATVVKPGAGQVYGWYLFNAAAATRFLKLYNKPGPPNVGVDTPMMTIGIPAGAAANVWLAAGVAFGAGVSFATTVNAADNDSTAVTAGDLVINIFYA